MTEKELQQNGVNDPPELDPIDEGFVQAESTVVGCAIALMTAVAVGLGLLILAVAYFSR